MAETTVLPTENFDYYAGGIFWNSFDLVNTYLNKCVTGHPYSGWIQHFLATHGKKNEALILNCGNGWVERELFRQGVISRAIGIDISEKSIAGCIAEAQKMGMPADYRLADANLIEFDQKFDLVVNFAAMHHVSRINRMAALIAEATRGCGLFLNYDYVGAHRNQYDHTTWTRCIEVRERLPKKYQPALAYPHFLAMMAGDPTEAVHSELFNTVLSRHFDTLDRFDFGGGVAYHVLMDNRILHQEQHTAEGQAAIEFILAEDRKLLNEHPASNLFSFVVARAKNTPPDDVTRSAWQQEEDARELRAKNSGGRYYPPTEFETLLYG